ncbi:hypothetical protein [Kitasatospora sp. MAP5-34]|uniref:hypothetical protein n=1 Tax=Kitasatospora sp. MAP5-34 TaxID=3035102 RepID=UPI0024760EF5|nr:hypothetical protein [Kitasatospora sp. MAP5-34]
MFQYEMIQQRNAELHRLAEHSRLVREAQATSGRRRTGVLSRLARSVRPAVAPRRAACLAEC